VLRKAVVVFAIVAAIATALYAAGFRIALDGSGMLPRFVSSGPDYDALEADRARQRTSAPQQSTTGRLRAERFGVQEEAAPVKSAAPPSAPEAGESIRESAPAPRAPMAVWPDFRGPARDGRSAEAILTDWPSSGLRQLWKQPIGLGYASFVVAGGRAFTIEQRRRQEVVAAYDVDTGRELWTNGWDGEFVETMGGDGPRATPTYHDGRLYALGALGEFRCLDAATGTVVWRRNILADNQASNLEWGMSASPLIVDDKVIVLPGGSGGRSVVAYNKATGDVIWRALDDRQAYVSPMLVTLAGVRQVLIVSATRASGLDPADGTQVWAYSWPTGQGINVAQPVLLGGDRVFLSASYGQGAAVFEVRRDGDRFTTRTVWENSRMKNKFTSSLLHEGHLYGLDESILACVDAATGELKWKGGRYGYGQPIIAGNHLIVLTESGEVVLVKATPDRHEEVARFSAIEGKTWNHPVVANGRLLVRNLREMAAFDVRPR
jgi:outer membrane protein assembly factor BamB